MINQKTSAGSVSGSAISPANTTASPSRYGQVCLNDKPVYRIWLTLLPSEVTDVTLAERLGTPCMRIQD
jgi:hypothetical protein